MAKFKVQPLGELVIIEPISPESKTKSGIIIPETAKEKPKKGFIVAVGLDQPKNSMLKVGMNVLYDRGHVMEITVDEKQYLIMRESTVLAII